MKSNSKERIYLDDIPLDKSQQEEFRSLIDKAVSFEWIGSDEDIRKDYAVLFKQALKLGYNICDAEWKQYHGPDCGGGD